MPNITPTQPLSPLALHDVLQEYIPSGAITEAEALEGMIRLEGKIGSLREMSTIIKLVRGAHVYQRVKTAEAEGEHYGGQTIDEYAAKITDATGSYVGPSTLYKEKAVWEQVRRAHQADLGQIADSLADLKDRAGGLSFNLLYKVYVKDSPLKDTDVLGEDGAKDEEMRRWENAVIAIEEAADKAMQGDEEARGFIATAAESILSITNNASLQKPSTPRNADYLEWLTQFPCPITGSYTVDAAHLPSLQKGTGHKGSDLIAIPLDHDLHMRLHAKNHSAAWFEETTGYNMYELALNYLHFETTGQWATMQLPLP